MGDPRLRDPIPCPPIGAVCLDCGHLFAVRPATAAWFGDRGWPTPRRCASCRRLRTAARQALADRDAG